jgi:hypothetical protein
MASIEQRPPHRPNFLLVVVLSAVGILVVFAIALLMLHVGPHRLLPGKHTEHPTTRLVLPGAAVDA